MAITLLFGTGHESSVTPPTHAADDWLYLIAECSSGTIATPTDWAIAPGFPLTHNGGSTVLSVFRRLAVNGSTPNAALSGGTNHMWGVICAVTGADLDEPQMSEAASPGTGASVSGYAPGLVTREDNAVILAMIAYSLDSAGPIGSAAANSSLSSVTEEYDAGTVTNDGGGLVCISGAKASAGTVLPTTCTLTSTSFCSGTIAFRPALATPYAVADTVTIAGSPAPDGGTVEVWDTIDGVLAGTATLSSGDGSFSVSVPYNTADRYRAVYDDGSSYGASPKGTAS